MRILVVHDATVDTRGTVDAPGVHRRTPADVKSSVGAPSLQSPTTPDAWKLPPVPVQMYCRVHSLATISLFYMYVSITEASQAHRIPEIPIVVELTGEVLDCVLQGVSDVRRVISGDDFPFSLVSICCINRPVSC